MIMIAEELYPHSKTSGLALVAAMFERMAEPLLLCDSDLSILAANHAARELLQGTLTVLAGRRAYEALPAQPPCAPCIPAPRQTRLEWHSQLMRRGELVRLEVSGDALHDTPAGIAGWVLTLKPVAEPRRGPEFIGRAPAVLEMLDFVGRIARSRASSILLLGESGTGKELIAHRLHALSSRAAAPFVPINCAALPESLLESELFGYEKGAFTGATQAKEGLLETAAGGTVFLDEIGELALPLQAKLLRAVEEHTFRRIGGKRNIAADVRFIAATNVNLEKAIQAQRFRSDLYYRLSSVQIQLPPLRERPEDIHELALHLVAHFNSVHRRHVRGIEFSVRRLLELHSWPGNVRELRNVIERAVLVETSSLITPASVALPGSVGSPAPNPEPGENRRRCAGFSLHSRERELITAALGETGGNQLRAAELLGIGRFSLRYKMKKFGLL